MPSLREIRAKRDAILACAHEHGASAIRIFGSVSRGEENEGSDVDFLVTFDDTRTLLDHAGLINDLADLLGAKVDVVEETGISPYVRDEVLHDAVPL